MQCALFCSINDVRSFPDLVRGQNFQLKFQRKRTLVGNLLAPILNIFHYLSAVAVVPCWFFCFLTGYVSFTGTWSSLSRILRWTCYYLWFSSFQDFAKKNSVLPSSLWTMYLISCYLWAYFSIVPPTYLQVYKSTSLCKIWKTLMHGDHTLLHYQFIKNLLCDLYVWTWPGIPKLRYSSQRWNLRGKYVNSLMLVW